MGFPIYVVLIAAICIAGLAIVVKVTDNRHTTNVLFALYIIAVLIVTLLVRTYDVEVKTLLNPFSKYITLGNSFVENGWRCIIKKRWVITEILLNIMLFVPLGFMLPVLHESFRKWWKMLLLGLAFSLLIECAQLVLHMGCFDTADLIHNTIGSYIGYMIWVKKMRK